MPVIECHADSLLTSCLFIGQGLSKLSSVEVTYLGSMLSKHLIPVLVILAKHDGLVRALCQYF